MEIGPKEWDTNLNKLRAGKTAGDNWAELFKQGNLMRASVSAMET